jgi:anti-sigma regulatory factor (Ser/Thr protein kinase)
LNVVNARIDLIPTDDASAKARVFILATLFEWGHRPAVALVDAVATELVTNAVVHATGPVGLELSLDDDTLRLAVSDEAVDEIPRLRPTPRGAENGYGLHIVDSLSLDWGHTRNHHHKTVWATIDLNRRF